MPGPSSALIRSDGPRGFLLRLHRDRRGLASIEFILAAPVILLIVMAIKQSNLISVRRMDTMRELRNAAFAEANGLSCTSDFSRAFPDLLPPLPDINPPGEGPERTTCASRPSHEGGGDPQRTFIWEDIKRGARGATDNLPGNLANEKPKLVTATATRVFRYSSSPFVKPFRWADTFTVDDATLFASTNDTTRRGYDPTLRQAVRGVAPSAGDLFDGIFPGAK